MKKRVALGLGLASMALLAWTRRRTMLVRLMRSTKPPVLKKKPYKVAFGAVKGENRGENPMVPVVLRDDPYFWCRDDRRTNEEVLEHLRAENHYTEVQTAHLESFRGELYKEMLSHVKETDDTVPFVWGKYKYFNRNVKGCSYVFHCRVAEDGKEEVYLDENEISKGLKHCDVSCTEPSPDHKLVAYALDSRGYETYTIYIKDIESGKLLPDVIEGTAGSVEWGMDNSTLYYSTFDDAHRVDKIWRHRLGHDGEDELLYTEEDEEFNAGFGKTKTGIYMLIGSHSSETSEVYVLDLRYPGALPTCIAPRVPGIEYHISHLEDKFFIVTNKDGAVNFKLMWTSTKDPGPENWVDVFPYNPRVKIDYIECFSNHFVMMGRQNGFTVAFIVNVRDSFNKHKINFAEDAYTVGTYVNKEYETDKVVITYTSLTTPLQTIEYDMNTREHKLIKETPCPNYDCSLYKSDYFKAKAEDGTEIPISLVYRKNLRTPGVPQPLHLYGYGSYEVSIDPTFRHTRLPFLDRGVIYAIAHVRGGGEMGRTWYEDAKYLNKKRTFTDFISCAEHLVKQAVTKPALLSIEGRSAGGLLIGAVVNMRPDLFHCVLAGVPFVDVMNTMSDATIPLTTGEWAEWGNNNEEKYFDYMLSYSPYDNVEAKDYPNMLVTSGLHDPRVAYWEPMKWIGKLREMKTNPWESPNGTLLCLKMDLSSGHFSSSDRYNYLREMAFDTAFVLDQLGVAQRKSPSVSTKAKSG